MAPRSGIALVSLLATLAASQATNPELCPYGYVGCYANGVLQDDYTTSLAGPLVIENCLDICYSQGYYYGGARNGNECWCADNLVDAASQVSDSACNIPCEGNANELCGGTVDQTVYQVAPEAASCQAAAAPPPADTTSSVVPVPTISILPTTSPTGPYPVTNTSMTVLLPPVGPVGTGGMSAMPSSNAPASNTPAGTVTSGSGTSTVASTTSPTVAPPGPTVSGTTKACYAYQVVAAGSSCYNIQQQYGIDFNYFQSLNPSLNAACSNLLSGYAYCINGVPAARVAGSSASASTTKPAVVTVSTVSPGQTGTAAASARHSYTSDGSVCRYMTYTYNMGGATVGSMSS